RGIAAKEPKRVVRISGVDHSITVTSQNILGKPPDGILVLDQQNDFAMAELWLDGRRACRNRRGFRGDGKVELEGSAHPDFTIHENTATALFHDPVNGRKAETGALALFLGREKRLKR